MENQPLPLFPLFPTAYEAGVFEPSDIPCACCGRTRGWVYTGPQYGPRDDDPPICPWCIADGRAAERLGVSFSDPTQYPLFPSTPQLPPDEQKLVRERTPAFITWQADRWLACCGRACVYLGEAGPGDLRGRFAEAVPSLVADENWSPEQVDEFIDSVGHGSPAAYIFRCRVCGRLRGYWDMD